MSQFKCKDCGSEMEGQSIGLCDECFNSFLRIGKEPKGRKSKQLTEEDYWDLEIDVVPYSKTYLSKEQLAVHYYNMLDWALIMGDTQLIEMYSRYYNEAKGSVSK